MSAFLHTSSLARSSARAFSTSSAAQHGIKTLGVVGAGQMGLGVAYVAAKVSY